LVGAAAAEAAAATAVADWEEEGSEAAAPAAQDWVVAAEGLVAGWARGLA
jgi:hypothetical protein